MPVTHHATWSFSLFLRCVMKRFMGPSATAAASSDSPPDSPFILSVLNHTQEHRGNGCVYITTSQ